MMGRRKNNSIVICIPTKREPPVLTLESYPTDLYETFIIADPRVVDKHIAHYHREQNVTVFEGKKGMGAQSAECYRIAFAAHYELFFRMDDDLVPGTFVTTREEINPGNIDAIIDEAYHCLVDTGTSHAGFSNTSRLDWLGDGFKRTYGLIHGGANIAKTTPNPEPQFMDSRLVRGEDVYRTCGHKTSDRIMGNDGSVGRVAHIGFNKAGSTRVSKIGSSITATQAELDKSRDIILEKFGHIVSCDGTRWIHNDTVEIPNWRHRRFPKDWRP